MKVDTSPEMASDHPVDIPVPRWVISDTHFAHANILAYCPWRTTWASSITEHDESIIAAWRGCVGPDDVVLHLGDFSMGAKEAAVEIRRRLPGRIILIRGNHDRSPSSLREAGFDTVCSAAHIVNGGRHWFARHNPAAFSPREAAIADRLLHGHCHGNGYREDIHPAIRQKAFDCSLDAVRSIAPVAWDQVPILYDTKSRTLGMESSFCIAGAGGLTMQRKAQISSFAQRRS